MHVLSRDNNWLYNEQTRKDEPKKKKEKSMEGLTH